MKVHCSNCTKKFTVGEDQIYDYKQGIIISCPECNTDIKIYQESIKKIVEESTSSLLYGDRLKKRILKSVKSLPPMPQVVMKAHRIISDPESSFHDFAKVIEADQAISARILQIANSAYYGAMGKVSSIQRASVILGTKTLTELLTLACSSTLLGNRLNGYELDAGDLWTHSLAVASGSKIIAEKYRPELADDAFTAGLLHDSGKLVLDQYISERKISFAKLIKEGEKSFLKAEEEVLGFNHAEIASEVCLKWQIPENISHAIRHHHDPTKSPKNELTSIIHIGDAIAMMSGMGIGLDGMLYSVHGSALDLLGISETDINEIMCEAADYTASIKNEM